MNSPATRTAARRSFSTIRPLRAVARPIETRPFRRLLPRARSTARPDWGREAKRVGTQALVFFPVFAVLLGWPLVAKSVFDGHV